MVRGQNASRDFGINFEDNLRAYFTEFLKTSACQGICYKMHDDGAGYQPIDILIDSKELGYIGIECKSTFEVDDLELWKLNRAGEFGIGQIERQHAFLRNAGRYGVMAIEIRKLGETWFLPHQYIFNKIERQDTHLTMKEIKDIGLKQSKNLDMPAFSNFIKCWCETGAYYERVY